MKRASAHVVPLRGYLSEHWITAQIRYHEDTARRQGAWDSRLFAATGVLFLITAVAAADAEHLMRAENSDWFGVMRFHDVGADHFSPPRPSSLPRRDLQFVSNRLVSLQQHQSVDHDGMEASGDETSRGTSRSG